MARQKQSRGKCIFCEKEFTNAGMSKHLKSCSQKKELIEKTDSGSKTKEKIYHLKIKDRYTPQFWIHLEMRGKTPLKELDNYLRAIWLECCGHLSQFSNGAMGDEIPMKTAVQSIFKEGVALNHVYDFGTSSETVISIMEERLGGPLHPKNPITLMARNFMPEVSCMECDKNAEWICMECVYEDEAFGLLCRQHKKVHDHDAYGEPMQLFNSPRVGICGYHGPAVPTY